MKFLWQENKEMFSGEISVNSVKSARKSRNLEKKWGDFEDLENGAYDVS